MARVSGAAALAVLIAGCGGSGWVPPKDPYGDAPPSSASTRADARRAPAPPPVPLTDDPRVSRSAGQVGGVVLLWPRVIPSERTVSLRYVAQPLQERLHRLVQKALPGRPVDVRPEPERVCPRSGCDGVAVGVLLVSRSQGCAAIAQISRPGQVPALQIPWVGRVRLGAPQVPFREPPESNVTVIDFARCDQLVDLLDPRGDSILRALIAAGR